MSTQALLKDLPLDLPMDVSKIGLIGYGEVGRIFADGLANKPGVQRVSAWDLKFVRQLPAASVILACASMQALCESSSFIISAVTASQTLAVAREAAGFIRQGTVFLDLNSASPHTKQKAAALIEAAGAIYVEAGVMTSVPPYGIKVPMLLGGPGALALAELLQSWDLDTSAVSDRLGVASAIKMCRSVMIKGLEALVIESYAAARHYGVEDHMIATLEETFPGIDWTRQGAYFFSRVAQHGKRRAEEMRESANTVHEAGFEPIMTAAIARKHQWMADQSAGGIFEGLTKDSIWQEYADALMASAGATSNDC